jgi:hypothetical protein
MASGHGENSPPDGNSKKYVENTKFWDNLAADKKRKEKESRENEMSEKIGV